VRSLKAQIAELEKLPRLTAEDAELLKDLRAQRAAREAQGAAVPSFVEDPKGHVDARLSEVVKRLEKAEQSVSTSAAQQQQQEQLRQLATTISTHESAFVQQNPDYHQALEHARSVRAAQLRVMAPEATDQQIAQQVGIEELQLAAQALKQGRNPAEVAYTLAQHFGYTKAQAAAAAQAAAQNQQQQGSGAGAAAAAALAGADADRASARTMGGGGLADQDDDGSGDDVTTPELAEAFGEVFGRR
jgi:hypothetical protein